MPAHSRIRLVADQFRIDTSESGAGGLVFELGTVGGVSGLMLRQARIKDLSVDTIHLNEGSVTVPDFTQIPSNVDFVSTGGVGSNTVVTQTFAEQDIDTTGVAGEPIFFMLIQKGIAQYVSGAGGSMTIKALLNNSEVLVNKSIGNFGGTGSTIDFQRLSMASVTATGSLQSFNIKWQGVATLAATTTFRIQAGARVMTVAMKR